MGCSVIFGLLRVPLMKKIKQFLLTTVMLGMASATWAGPLSLFYSNLIVFGDSIVDTGNVQALSLGGGGGDPAPASLGYFEGRFTNGQNPADVVNQAIEDANMTGSLLGGDNYSFGGARARADADGIPDLALQVQAYLGGPVDTTALHLINVGGNDIRDILVNGLDPTSTIAGATAAIASQVLALQGAGADEILFVGVGNVGGIPEIQPAGADAIAFGRFLSEQLNLAIWGALAPLGVDFYDTIGFFDDLLPVLEGEGVNTTEACLLSGLADPFGAPTCDGFAFFDTVHPTTRPLQLLGADIVDHLVPVQVPIPATFALFGLGLAGLGWSRRKKV
jgi:outer membrane lipase/esterase